MAYEFALMVCQAGDFQEEVPWLQHVAPTSTSLVNFPPAKTSKDEPFGHWRGKWHLAPLHRP
jgi:hypothetical protein